jgi:hypothetical protein
MSEPTSARTAFGRAGRRVVYHMIQAAIEGLKAIEAVIEELGGIGADGDENGGETTSPVQRIEIE